MSYEVTATRKRPRNFESLAGQEFVVATLQNAIKTGRIAHAYLFSGPRGVGKTSSARIVARALNCDQGPTATPCGICSHCTEIQAGNSMDVIEIDGASNTSVNDIREIKDEVLFAPNSSRYKIYIIDEVHMLSNSAFNALLKTIEEPPPYIIFIFATTEIHKVPATIRSRCQQFNFRLIPAETIKSLLRKIATEGDIEAEDDALFWIAKEATGSLRDAYTLFDQIVAFSNNQITLDKIREKLGLVGLDQINQLSHCFASGDRESALLELDNIITQGVSAEQFIIDLTEYFRSILFIKSGITRETLLGYKPDRFDPTVIKGFSLTQIETAIDYLLTLFRNIRFSLNQRFELELLISKFCSLKDHHNGNELLVMIKQLKAELTGDAPQKLEIKPISPKTNTPPSELTISQPDEKKKNPLTAFRESITESPALSRKPFNRNQQENNTPTPAAQENQTQAPHITFAPPVNEGNTTENIITETQNKERILDALDCHHQPALCSSINHADQWKFEQNRITLFFNSHFHSDIVSQNIAALETAAQKIFHRAIVFRVAIQQQDKRQMASAKTDPAVDMVVNVFKGQVIKN